MTNEEVISKLDETQATMEKIGADLTKYSKNPVFVVANWAFSLMTIAGFGLALYLLFTGAVFAGLIAGVLSISVYVLRFMGALFIGVLGGIMEKGAKDIGRDLDVIKSRRLS